MSFVFFSGTLMWNCFLCPCQAPKTQGTPCTTIENAAHPVLTLVLFFLRFNPTCSLCSANSGCGKTSLCNEFTDADFWVLDEGFMDMPDYALHPQSLLMETTWVCQWFTRLLKKMSELKVIYYKLKNMKTCIFVIYFCCIFMT